MFTFLQRYYGLILSSLYDSLQYMNISNNNTLCLGEISQEENRDNTCISPVKFDMKILYLNILYLKIILDIAPHVHVSLYILEKSVEKNKDYPNHNECTYTRDVTIKLLLHTKVISKKEKYMKNSNTKCYGKFFS